MDLNKIKQFFDAKSEEEVNELLNDANLSLGDYTELVMAIDDNDLEALKRIITKNSIIGDLIDKAGLSETAITEYSSPEDKRNQKKHYSDKARGFGMPKGRSPLPSKKQLGEAAPEGMEDWIEANKSRFKKKYGKGYESYLYGKAWNMKKEQTNESTGDNSFNMGYDAGMETNDKEEYKKQKRELDLYKDPYASGFVSGFEKEQTNESQTPSLGDTLANKVAFTDNERDLRLQQAQELEALKSQQDLEKDILNSKHKAEDYSSSELEKMAIDSMTQDNQEMDIEIVVGQPELEVEEEMMDFTGVNLEDILSDLGEVPTRTMEKKSDGMITVTEDNDRPLTSEEQRDLDQNMKELENKSGSDVSVVDSDTNTAEDSEFVGFDDESGSAIVKDKRGDVSIVDATSVSMKESTEEIEHKTNYSPGDKLDISIGRNEPEEATLDRYDFDTYKIHFTKKDGSKTTRPLDMFENNMRDWINLVSGKGSK